MAYEGISSFLHYKRQKAPHKAVYAMENKVDIQCNKIFHLEDSMVMCGIYNSDTLEDLIKTVHRLHNQSTWNERLLNLLLFLTTAREKYVKMYERLLTN